MYSDFFQLNSLPFQAAIDKGVFYPSAGATQSMATLQHGLISGDRLLVLTGAPGTGKSCLVNKLIAELSGNVRHICMQAVYENDAEFLQGLALTLSLDINNLNRVALLEVVIEELQRISACGEKLLIVIDNAQFFGSECLKMINVLVDFQTARNYSVSIVLVGRLNLVKNLIKTFGSLRDQQFRMLSTVSAYSQLDTTGYIKYRLAKAGQSEQRLFDDNGMKSIHSISQGIARRINALCDAALLGAYASQQIQVNDSHIQQASSRLGWNSIAGDTNKTSITQIVKNGIDATSDKVSVKDIMGNSVSYHLSDSVLRIGRAPDCQIRLNEINISRYQAEISCAIEGYTIVNKGSTTPVMLNGNSIESASIKDGDVVSIGNYSFHFTVNKSDDAKTEDKPTEQVG